MLVTILPYFLAAHVVVHQDSKHYGFDWERYGPESSYDVLINVILTDQLHTENFCSSIASELKCRSKGSDTLSCRFANEKVLGSNHEDSRCSKAKDFILIGQSFLNEDPFEVRFDHKGIENLVVSRNIPRWRLDMIRVIVGQLNVGFELENDKPNSFVTMENSSVSYCEVEVKVSRSGYGRDNIGRSGGQFDIVFEPERDHLLPLNRADLRIMKVRRPKKCPNRKISIFGNHGNVDFGDRNAFMEMTSSVSHMQISHRVIYSFTESTGIMIPLNRSRTMQFYQKTSLSLKSIYPARGPFLEIMNPASTTLYPHVVVGHALRT